jgi:hypothetical protein
MAQASGPGLAWLAPGLGLGLGFQKPKSDEAKPKPWFPGQAKPAQHYTYPYLGQLAVFSHVYGGLVFIFKFGR